VASSSSLLEDYLIGDPKFKSQPGCTLPAFKHPFPIPYHVLEIFQNPKRKDNQIWPYNQKISGQRKMSNTTFKFLTFSYVVPLIRIFIHDKKWELIRYEFILFTSSWYRFRYDNPDPSERYSIDYRENLKSQRTNLGAKKAFITNVTWIWSPSLGFDASPLLDILGRFFVVLIKFLREI
jgi:hypothetical protein